MKKKAKKVLCYIGIGLSFIIPTVIGIFAYGKAYDRGYEQGEEDGWIAGAKWGMGG
jgi:hypothetical protein